MCNVLCAARPCPENPLLYVCLCDVIHRIDKDNNDSTDDDDYNAKC